MKEIWAKIKDYPNYEVSSTGRLRSLCFNGTKGKRKLMKQTLTTTGYLCAYLFNGEKPRKNYRIHRIVALSFLDRIEGKDYINHKNGIKIDNRIENLEWVNKSEDLKHAYKTGLRIGINQYSK